VEKPVLEVAFHKAKRARGKDNINIHFAVTRLEFWTGHQVVSSFVLVKPKFLRVLLSVTELLNFYSLYTHK